MLAAYAILVLCIVVPEAPSNIAPEKIQAIQAMSFEQRLVTLFTYVYIRSFTSKKNIAKVMLSLLWKSAMKIYYETNGRRYFGWAKAGFSIGATWRTKFLLWCYF